MAWALDALPQKLNQSHCAFSADEGSLTRFCSLLITVMGILCVISAVHNWMLPPYESTLKK